MNDYKSIESLWLQALNDIFKSGIEASPRSMNSKELIAHTYFCSNPRNRIIFNKDRKINLSFAVAEWLWIMTGRNDVAMLEFYNKKMKDFSDDGLTLHGAYGRRIFGVEGDKEKHHNQFIRAAEKIALDNDTRQALITIWNPILDNEKTKDIPCSIMLHFLLRRGQLNLIVYMRSNDVWLGLPYDSFTFTMIQEFMSQILEVELGNYFHMTGSLHLYESNYQMAQNVIDNSDLQEPRNINMNRMTGGRNVFSYLKWLSVIETKIRNSMNFEKCYDTIMNSYPDDYWRVLALILLLKITPDEEKKALKKMIFIEDSYFLPLTQQ